MRTYRYGQVIAKMHHEHFASLYTANLMPRFEIGNRTCYDADYIDALTDGWKRMALGGAVESDKAFARLLFLKRAYAAREPTLLRHYRLLALEPEIIELQQLEARGEVVRLGYVIDRLPMYSPISILHWSSHNLVTVKIARQHYLSAHYAQRVVWAIMEYETVFQAAARLGAHPETLSKAILAGRVAGFLGPDGLWRLDPAKLEEVPWAMPEIEVTVAQMAEQLGAELSTVRWAINRGEIKSSLSRDGQRRTVPYEEFERWKTRFTTLNAGFDWLQVQPIQATVTVGQAARLLGVVDSTVGRWCASGVLPCYDRTFGNKGTYFVVKAYVKGLVEFAGGTPIRKPTAEAYAVACARAGVVV